MVQTIDIVQLLFGSGEFLSGKGERGPFAGQNHGSFFPGLQPLTGYIVATVCRFYAPGCP